MANPTEKSAEVETLISSIMGKNRRSYIRANVCMICDSDVDLSNDFRDELSKKEFTISGMCQTCQDSIFK